MNREAIENADREKLIRAMNIETRKGVAIREFCFHVLTRLRFLDQKMTAQEYNSYWENWVKK